MRSNAPQADVDAVLEKIKGIELKNVSDDERRHAVERAVKMIGVNAHTAVSVLIDVIEANEAQLAVHSEPSDPDDLDD